MGGVHDSFASYRAVNPSFERQRTQQDLGGGQAIRRVFAGNRRSADHAHQTNAIAAASSGPSGTALTTALPRAGTTK